MPIHDIDGVDNKTQSSEQFLPPEWSLISPQGLMASLQMAVTVFTKVGIQITFKSKVLVFKTFKYKVLGSALIVV